MPKLWICQMRVGDMIWFPINSMTWLNLISTLCPCRANTNCFDCFKKNFGLLGWALEIIWLCPSITSKNNNGDKEQACLNPLVTWKIYLRQPINNNGKNCRGNACHYRVHHLQWETNFVQDQPQKPQSMQPYFAWWKSNFNNNASFFFALME